jgi:hypothetical protein
MSNALQAIAILNDLIGLAATTAEAMQKVGGVIQQAQAAGRDVSDAELDALKADRQAVIADLDEEIERRGG